MKKHLIFDLDGTLIDSAPSILSCFDLAFTSTGTPLKSPLDSNVIGPPLMETLRKLSGSENASLLNTLATAFKEHYDTSGYLQSVVFDGIPAMLQQLKAAGYQLYIATNKRFYPTGKIIAHLQWDAYFDGVYALDYFNPPLKKKAEMIAAIVDAQALKREDCLYIGDRLEDGLSAEANRMDFVLVTWGYAEEASQVKPDWQRCERVEQLAAIVAAY